ncbi:UPF0575 protein C19orf67 homolog [Nelusetta ayraudi]|uniref:UPF0575 protein C19orf67 homolog n=1 Tax=Nelusetta ayraudi TaxID=303726 RepID=UPI003F715851
MNYQLNNVTFDTYSRRMQLLEFSQQLCNKLEQLVLTYANQNLLCLDELEPHSVSSFCIGQTQLRCLKLTTFFYCRPTPYLAQVETGLHKRMRWNVVRLANEHCKENSVGNIEYYFLCYEDVLSTLMQADGNVQGCDKERVWSIGLWVPVFPGPDTDDIFEWILCNTPQANYHRLLLLGRDEPSSSLATDVLLQLLLSPQKAK